MLTHVYDKVTETMYYVTNINLIDEEYQVDGTTLYELDLVSVDDADIAYFNVPCTITEKDGSYTYAIADISKYRNEKEIKLYDCEYRDNTLIFSYPDTQSKEMQNNVTISIYQSGKEHTTKEATTIAELIEILEEIQDNYTEVVVSGAFCKAIKRSKQQ